MFVVALLICIFLVLVDAHVYERCELARELTSLGVSKEHLATWVCIAFHESRFDTAARNPHSGDHGLLQISEIYWCGPGKACGLPCSALRDEDISDDVECAQQIYKEHTRLQGDGFLAWVVYSHHCAHNAKKYLADCNSSTKNITDNIEEKGRSLRNRHRNITMKKNFRPEYSDIDRLKPPYLTINSLFDERFGKRFEDNYLNNNERKNWLNYKIDDIDSLKLPVLNKNGEVQFITSHTPNTTTRRRIKTTTVIPTTTTIDPYLIGIRPPMPRRIESNQFRRKNVSNKNFVESDIHILRITDAPNLSKTTNVKISTAMTSQGDFLTTIKPLSDKSVLKNDTMLLTIPKSSLDFQKNQSTYTNIPLIAATTVSPIGISYRQNKILYHPESPKNASSAILSSQTKTNLVEHTTAKPGNGILFNFAANNYYTTIRPSTMPDFQTSASKPRIVEENTTPKQFSRIDYQKSLFTSISINNITSPNYKYNISIQNQKTNVQQLTSTTKPLFDVIGKNTGQKINNSYTYMYKNNLMIEEHTNKNIEPSSKVNTGEVNNITLKEYSTNSLRNVAAINFSNFANASHKDRETPNVLNETQPKSTTKTWSYINPFTYKPQTSSTSWKFSPFTFKPIQHTTVLPVLHTNVQSNNSSSWLLNSKIQEGFKTSSTTKAPEMTKRTTSIFDLYLRPQKVSTLPLFQFFNFNTSLNRGLIFAGGTTASPRSLQTSLTNG